MLCVALTTTPRITSLATPVYREARKGALFDAYDTTSSSTTTCSNPTHLALNPCPRSLYPDLPDDFEIPPYPSSKAKYEKPRMTKRTVVVKYDCKECKSERARPGCNGLTILEEIAGQPELELMARCQLWTSWTAGFESWWNDPAMVRGREGRGSSSMFAEDLLFDGEVETALQERVESEERETGEDGRVDADQDQGEAATRHDEGTKEGEVYVSIFGGD